MIVTLTPNTAIDHIMFVPRFVWGTTMRADRVIESIAGKATDASWILGELGVRSLALGFAAGATGSKIESILRAKGVYTDFIPVGGESRRNIVIISTGGQSSDGKSASQSTVTGDTLNVTPEDVTRLRPKYLAALDRAPCVVMGGQLPPGLDPSFYTDFVNMAQQRGVPVIFDASEPYLSAGLAASPAYVKPNHHELAALVGQKIETMQDAYHAGMALKEKHKTTPIITLGQLGALALLPEGAFHIPPLKVPVVNTAGAGDAVLAGMAWALGQGKPMVEGLRMGFGAAAATVTKPGTAECTKADVERYAAQVEITPFAVD